MRKFFLDDVYIGVKEKLGETDFNFDGTETERYSFGFYEYVGKFYDKKFARDLACYLEVSTGKPIYVDKYGNTCPFAGTTPSIRSFRYLKRLPDLIMVGFDESLKRPNNYSFEQMDLLRRCASVVSHYDRLSDTDEHVSKLASFFINVYLKTYGNPLKTEIFMIEENARKAREKFVVIK